MKLAIDFKVVIPNDYATIGPRENFIGQVFTSYSRRDTEIVDNIVGKLSQAGMNIWIDREGLAGPLYLVEAWTCQGGEIVFTAIGAFTESAPIKDEAGCAEPSRGQVFLAHKDGYVGSVEIQWPPQATSTP